MKLLTKPVIFISALFILMIAAACEKDGDKAKDSDTAIDSDKPKDTVKPEDSNKPTDSVKPVIVIENFKLVDGSGNDMGYYGTADNDWTFNNTLSDREMALFDFLPANVSLDNTAEAVISGNRLFAYPNPCAYTQSYNANASDSVVLKVVIVNDKLNVLSKTALKRKGAIQFAVNYYSDTLLYPNKSSLRLYYSFSAQNKLNYKAGYGDIKICRAAAPFDTKLCFP
jgi:hypothetical protein